jgi:putative phosphoesterase
VNELLLGVIADTHLLEADVPERILEAFRGADTILHAGDVVAMPVIDQLSMVAETIAVRGNMDQGDVTRVLQESRVIEVQGFKIGLTHGYGPPWGIVKKVRAQFDDVDCIIFGHTHQPLVEVREGILFFNPGSPTDKRFAEVNTFGLLEITDKLTPRLVYLDRPSGEEAP